jgi:hypothetical protein
MYFKFLLDVFYYFSIFFNNNNFFKVIEKTEQTLSAESFFKTLIIDFPNFLDTLYVVWLIVIQI